MTQLWSRQVFIPTIIPAHIKDAYFSITNMGIVFIFLAVQDSSIGDLVTHSLTHSLSERLLISATSEHYNDYNDTTVTLQ